MEATKSNNNKLIAIFSISMAFLAWMAVKLPMPALPALAHIFGTSAQTFKVSVTVNLLSFSISQIFWGPLSDRYGRRPILIIAFTLAIVGTLFAMLAMNVTIYFIGRILEGFAVGSAAPLGRAMMTDHLEKIKMARVYAWYAIAAILPPAVGPVIGGYLFVWFGWRYIFAFFLIMAIVFVLACVMYLPETHKNKLSTLSLNKIKNDVLFLMRSSYFWTYVITYALINGFMIAFYAAMPYWYVVQFHMGESDYAWLAFIPIATYIFGSSLTNRLLAKYKMDALLLSGIILTLALSALILLLALISKPSIIAVTLLLSIFSIASGMVTPMANANLMHQFRDKVTTLSALMSGIRVGTAALLVLISTNIHLATYWPLFFYTLTVALAALLFYFLFKHKLNTLS